MVGGLLRMAAIVATAGSALVSALRAEWTPASLPAPVSLFGGAVPVNVGSVGHIELDLEPAATSGLRRVRCAGVPAGAASCFVGR